MTIQELGILTKCPRRYELEQIIYQGQNQKNAIYRKALCIMTDGLAEKDSDPGGNTWDWPSFFMAWRASKWNALNAHAIVCSFSGGL